MTVVAAVVVAHTATARIEVEVPRVVQVVRGERTRPVVAVASSAVETAIVAVASGGQEETIAVRCGEQPSVHAVLGRPRMRRVVVEFLPFLLGGHTPVRAPVGCGSVVLGQQGGQVVASSVFSESVAVNILVGTPVVGVLRLGLAPGEIVAVVLGAVGTHVAGGPQQTARQAEVNIDMFIICCGETELVAITKLLVA